MNFYISASCIVCPKPEALVSGQSVCYSTRKRRAGLSLFFFLFLSSARVTSVNWNVEKKRKTRRGWVGEKYISSSFVVLCVSYCWRFPSSLLRPVTGAAAVVRNSSGGSAGTRPVLCGCPSCCVVVRPGQGQGNQSSGSGYMQSAAAAAVVGVMAGGGGGGDGGWMNNWSPPAGATAASSSSTSSSSNYAAAASLSSSSAAAAYQMAAPVPPTYRHIDQQQQQSTASTNSRRRKRSTELPTPPQPTTTISTAADKMQRLYSAASPWMPNPIQAAAEAAFLVAANRRYVVPSPSAWIASAQPLKFHC